MGTIESSEGRRVSFGMDEEERVRVLQGIRLSENVVQRMKDPSPLAEGQQPAPPPAAPDYGSTAPQKEPKLPTSKIGGGRQPSGVKEDLKRFRQEQATVQDELFRVVRREREAAAKHMTAAPPAVEGSTDQEKQQSARLARELESREAELRHHDTFYQEQLGCIERKNVEMYKLSSQQFHEAASKAENTIKPRRVEPVCSGLQAQILRCYRDHVQEVLLCSDLVKAYQHCVSATHKVQLPALGTGPCMCQESFLSHLPLQSFCLLAPMSASDSAQGEPLSSRGQHQPGASVCPDSLPLGSVSEEGRLVK